MAEIELELRTDALVVQLKQALGIAGNTPLETTGNILRLQGFLEQTPTPGVYRLYAADFGSHIDINKKDIIHAHQLAPEQNPLGGTTLWIRPSGLLDQNDFLRGAVAAMAVGRPGFPGPQAMPPPLSIFFNCPFWPPPNSIFFNCAM